MLDSDRQRVLARKRRLANKHMVNGNSQRIDIAARIDRIAFDLLRAHVERRAHGDPDLSQVLLHPLIIDASETEIGDLNFAVGRQHDIFRFDVTMDDTHLTGFLQRHSGLLQNIDRHLRLNGTKTV